MIFHQLPRPASYRAVRLPALDHKMRGHYRRLALIAANVVEASANKRATAAAVSGNLRGSHTVTFGGQTIRTVAGMFAGSTNSTVIVSAGVI
jgi:hypothetical protein